MDVGALGTFAAGTLLTGIGTAVLLVRFDLVYLVGLWGLLRRFLTAIRPDQSGKDFLHPALCQRMV